MNNRRSFLRNITAATSATFLAPASFLRAQGSNDAIRIAGIGVGGRGPGIFKDALYTKNARLVALCDVDAKRVANGKTVFEQEPNNAGQSIATYSDIRRLLESKDIDAVMIATPNHWHSLAAIWAAQAGKDVYVEKPVSHTVWEGRQLAAAALKYNRIIQSGTQSRSSGGLKAALEWLRGSPLGKLKYGRGTCYKPRGSIKKVGGPQPIPEGIDFDLWCGPAPKADLLREKLHYDWHWNALTGNGDLGNQNPHELDKARWGLGKQEFPTRVVSLGGRLGYLDNGDVANSQVTIYQWDDALLISDVRGLEMKSPVTFGLAGGPLGVGNVWWGTEGYVVSTNYQSGVAFDYDGKQLGMWSGGSSQAHFANLVKAARSRRHEDLYLDVEDGHLSSALAHLGNVSWALGEKVAIGTRPALGAGDDRVARTLESFEAHLRENAVDTGVTPLLLGREYAIDPQTERSTDDDANRLFTKDYRKGYELPRV